MEDTARQFIFDLPSRPALGRADFLVSPANELAVRQIDAWPDWPEGRIAVIGPEGSGKTHLAHVWAARSGARIMGMSGLSDLLITDVPEDGALVIEDVDRHDMSRAAQEVLFHLYNRLRAGGGSMMVSGRTAPATWPTELPDLASRLKTAAVARLGAPDDRLFSALLVKLFMDRQLLVKPDVIRFLVPRIDRSFVSAERAVDALDRMSLTSKRPVSVRMASRMLRNGPDPAHSPVEDADPGPQ